MSDNEDLYVHPKTVPVPMKRYQELLRAELELACLEEAGVDNWDGYSDAMRLMHQRHGDR